LSGAVHTTTCLPESLSHPRHQDAVAEHVLFPAAQSLEYAASRQSSKTPQRLGAAAGAWIAEKRANLRSLMWSAAGIVRNQAHLKVRTCPCTPALLYTFPPRAACLIHQACPLYQTCQHGDGFAAAPSLRAVGLIFQACPARTLFHSGNLLSKLSCRLQRRTPQHTWPRPLYQDSAPFTGTDREGLTTRQSLVTSQRTV